MEKVFQIAPNRVPHHKVVQFTEIGIFSEFKLAGKETKKNELLKRKARANAPLPSDVFFHQELCRRLLRTRTHTDRHTETQFSYLTRQRHILLVKQHQD